VKNDVVEFGINVNVATVGKMILYIPTWYIGLCTLAVSKSMLKQNHELWNGDAAWPLPSRWAYLFHITEGGGGDDDDIDDEEAGEREGERRREKDREGER
jgi:hypothetical protein